MYRCPFCSIVPPSLKVALQKHIKAYHNKLNRSCSCPYDNCGRELGTVYKYFDHCDKFHITVQNVDSNSIERKRKFEQDPKLAIVEPPKKINSSNSLRVNHDEIVSQIDFEVPSPFDEELLNFANKQETLAIETVVELLSDASLSRTAIQKVISIISHHKQKTLDSLNENDENVFGNNEKSQAKLNILKNSFHQFSTEHKMIKYLKDKMLLIEPITITIGLRKIFRRVRRKKVELKTYKYQMHIVPMEATLKKFLELPNVFAKIREIIDRNYDDYPVVSMLQGTYWKNIKAQSPNKIIIPINLYFDDYEVNDVLGSHRGLKKMGGVYFIIGCLPPEFSAKLENWFLAQIHKEVDYKKLGNKIIFRKLKKQLLDLRKNGIEIIVDNTVHRVYFELCKILGDNLGFNQILGFSACFSKGSFCRICLATSAETKVMVVQNDKLLRNRKNYAEDLENLKNPMVEISHGVKEQCVFEPIIDITKLLTVDPTHDLEEGAFGFQISIIIRQGIKKKYFDLATLNANIEFLVIDQAIGVNKPPEFTEKHMKKKGKIKLSSSETSFMIKYLGILVGGYFPKNSSIWKLYKLLRTIYYLVMAPSFGEKTPQMLKNVIKEHHKLYLKLKFHSLMPKHHFLLHYPMVMTLLGPLRYATAIRGEAFHSKFKRYAVVARSRKSPSYTLAMRHQLTLAKRFFQNKPLISEYTCKYTKNIEMNSLKNFEKFKENCPVGQNDTIRQISWASYGGTIYKSGMVVVIEKQEDKLPIFGEIEYIIEARQLIYFIVNELQTCQLNDHIQAYIVENSEKFKFVQQKYLADYCVYDSQYIKIPDRKSRGTKESYEEKKVIVSTFI